MLSPQHIEEGGLLADQELSYDQTIGATVRKVGDTSQRSED